MRIKNLYLHTLALGVLLLVPACHNGQNTAANRFTLWQLPSQTGIQMMSYVIRTEHGQILVVDGGNPGDAGYLRGFLAAQGNHVRAWFITHPDEDHIGALNAILAEPRDLKIDVVYESLDGALRPETAKTRLQLLWEERRDEATRMEVDPALLWPAHHLDQLLYEEVRLGQVLEFDGVRIEILGIKNPEITVNQVNNSSMVLRFSDTFKSVLFTGDLGREGGDKLLRSPYRSRLRSDYVQMSHHGSWGVSEEFYQEVQPRYCLWPTPLWEWNNDTGQGVGSGKERWTTLLVRSWMDKLKVQQDYVSSDGLYRID